MSSFTHYLEKEVLDTFIGDDNTLFMGLSRTDGKRAGNFAVWGDDPEDPTKKAITTEGIDEPGQGWFLDPEDDTWKTEASADLASTYARVELNNGATNWHAVEVVLGEEGDSELRLQSDVDWATAGAGEDWGNISHFFITDSATVGAGNILAWGQMPDSVQIVEGMTAKIWGNTVVIRMTD